MSAIPRTTRSKRASQPARTSDSAPSKAQAQTSVAQAGPRTWAYRGVVKRGLRPEYRAWWNAIRRCHNPEHRDYHRYGARGISVCRGWRKSFEAFYRVVGRRPSPTHSLDRYPNPHGNYEPGNVRWATRSEQVHNMRNNRWLEGFGKRLIGSDWARELGIPPEFIWRYSRRHGLSIEQIALVREYGGLRRGRPRKKVA